MLKGIDKKLSVPKKKKNRKEKSYWDKEDEILGSHIPHGGDATRSLHILINKWFYRLRGNCIILKNPCEAGNLKDCQIQYEIEYIEPNIMYKANKNYLSLQLENTKQKWVLLLVKFEEVMLNPKLFFSQRVVI